MITKNLRFMSAAVRGLDMKLADDEPSHIHVPRPSRQLRRDHADPSVEPTSGELGEIDPAAAQVTAQAA